ncbi:MAG: nucleotidyltransferase domain-containing protein [Candidatus Sumerlaeia bacterium]|nr:nucleotidyltransferase domain-containing protein [Candidatus Sumerlaeia bacterium]
MLATFGEQREEIERLCQEYGVVRLDVFGSAATGTLTDNSDADFLVEFIPRVEGAFERYFGLKERLEQLCGRPVDLVVTDAIRNPYFRKRVFETRRNLFGASCELGRQRAESALLPYC